MDLSRHILQWNAEGTAVNLCSDSRYDLPLSAKEVYAMPSIKKGKVYLIGAGPGNPDLLTVKGERILKSADIVLYDRLISDMIADLVPSGKKSICVGGDHGKDPVDKQIRINELMLDSVNKGLTVARLKSGDPFLFGRGGEEVDFLIEHGIKFEIIPGVSSALGVPTYAGIPLTHRDFSSSVFIVSGHRKESEENDWKTVAKLDGTIVILMGIGRIREIMNMLQEGGMNPDIPVAIVQNGTMKNQQILMGKVSDIADQVEKHEIVSPGIIIIGDVVKSAKLESMKGLIERIEEDAPWVIYR